MAWLALVPTIAILLPTIIWLAPPLARAVMPEPSWHAFPSIEPLIVPEPLEQVRYLIALFTPLVAAGFFLLARRWSIWTHRALQGATVAVVQVSLLVVMAYCWVDQATRRPWFSTLNLLLAMAFAGVMLALLPRSKLAVRPVSRRAGTVLFVVAGVVTALWLLPSLFGDSTIASAQGEIRYHLQFTMNELLSVASGRAPLVDYASQYTKLLPYAVAPVTAVVGVSTGTVTATMWVLSVTAMLAVYLTFKAVTDNAVVAMALYLPVLAVSMYMLSRAGDERTFLANLYGVVPLRVFGPLLVGWLLTRELRRPRRLGQILLFLVGTLVAVNNLEYGLPCVGGLLAGLWCARGAGGTSWSQTKSLLTNAVIGGGIAAAVVCLLTLGTTGSLPDPRYISHFNQVFAVEGFGLVPMPPFGLHVLFFLTFSGALVVAIVASETGSLVASRSPVLVGALAYSGVLGLGAFSYWVGRSHPDSLFAVFPTWGLTVGLLVWLVISEVTARPGSIALTGVVPAALVFTSFGLMATVLPQMPSPSGQFRRLTSGSPPSVDAPASSLACVLSPRPEKPCPLEPESFRHSAAVRFVERMTTPGEHVMILAGLGHLIGRESRVVNVSPYSHPDAIGFLEQMDFVLEPVDRGEATKIFLGISYPEISRVLQERGFVVVAQDETSELTLWQ